VSKQKSVPLLSPDFRVLPNIICEKKYDLLSS
jgi:hypothetical protein